MYWRTKKAPALQGLFVAVPVGFEPTDGLHHHMFSRHAPLGSRSDTVPGAKLSRESEGSCAPPVNPPCCRERRKVTAPRHPEGEMRTKSLLLPLAALVLVGTPHRMRPSHSGTAYSRLARQRGHAITERRDDRAGRHETVAHHIALTSTHIHVFNRRQPGLRIHPRRRDNGCGARLHRCLRLRADGQPRRRRLTLCGRDRVLLGAGSGT